MTRVVDAVALLLACLVGALTMQATGGNYWAGLAAAAPITLTYGWLVAPRLRRRADARTHAADTAPDGRLTRHH